MSYYEYDQSVSLFCYLACFINIWLHGSTLLLIATGYLMIHQCCAKRGAIGIAITFCLVVASQKWVLFDLCLTQMLRSFVSHGTTTISSKTSSPETDETSGILPDLNDTHTVYVSWLVYWQLSEEYLNPASHAIFSFSQFLEDCHNNKDERNISHYDLMEIFPSGLHFRQEKAEEL